MHIWYKKSVLLVTADFLMVLGVRFLCCFIKQELHVELFGKIHNESFRNYLMQKMTRFSTYHNMQWDVINVPPNITILRFLRYNIFKTVRWILTRLQTNHILPKIKQWFFFFSKFWSYTCPQLILLLIRTLRNCRQILYRRFNP